MTRSRILFVFLLGTLWAIGGWAQSAECVDAFDTLTRVREQRFSADSKPELEQLHFIVRKRTEACPELKDLWDMRAKLARDIGDLPDARLAELRRGTDYVLTGTDIQATRKEDFDPAAPVGKRWALVVGTSTFQASRLPSLEYGDQDLNRISSIFRNDLGFDQVTALTGKDFTLDRFRAALAQLRDRAEANDIVVIYILSHGYPTKEDPNETSFILTYDSKVGNSQERYLTSISVIGFVQEMYREIRAKRIVLLLDACYSGDAITGQRDYSGHPSPHLLEAFTRGSGRVVIAAAGASQRSWELPKQEQGAFAYCLDNVITASPRVMVGELFAELQACVSKKVRTDLGPGHVQEPVLFASERAKQIVLTKAK